MRIISLSSNFTIGTAVGSNYIHQQLQKSNKYDGNALKLAQRGIAHPGKKRMSSVSNDRTGVSLVAGTVSIGNEWGVSTPTGSKRRRRRRVDGSDSLEFDDTGIMASIKSNNSSYQLFRPSTNIISNSGNFGAVDGVKRTKTVITTTSPSEPNVVKTITVTIPVITVPTISTLQNQNQVVPPIANMTGAVVGRSTSKRDYAVSSAGRTSRQARQPRQQQHPNPVDLVDLSQSHIPRYSNQYTANPPVLAPPNSVPTATTTDPSVLQKLSMLLNKVKKSK